MSDLLQVEVKLSGLLQSARLKPLSQAQLQQFTSYFNLLQKWNAHINLTAIRDEDAILSRHFVECIACAQALPAGVTSLLDLGSGAGLPGIPIALCRPEISVTLAESQTKKAAFLQEVVRNLGLSASVFAGRAESLPTPFDCVTLRAVDHMESAVQIAANLTRHGGWLAPMTTYHDLPALQQAAGQSFQWQAPVALPASEDRILALAMKSA